MDDATIAQIEQVSAQAANLANDLAALARRLDHAEFTRLACIAYDLTVAALAQVALFALTVEEGE